MFWKLIPFLLTVVVAKPLYVGTPLSLEHALIGQPLSLLYQYGNVDQLGILSKGLLASHLGSQTSKGLPLIQSSLGLGTPEIPFPIKKEIMLPEKIAGALIKQVPKVSKLPISITPKALEFSSLGGGGLLEAGLAGASLLSGKSLLNSLGLSYGF